MNPTEYLPDALGGIANAIEELSFANAAAKSWKMDAIQPTPTNRLKRGQ